jgi:uncharacterized C2H2 Zn-finger protein
MKIPVIKSHEEIQNEIAEKLDKKEIEYFRCPECGEVYKLACGLISCGYCGYLRDDYSRGTNGSITKNETKSRN